MRTSDERGISLIEVIVATGIFAASLASIAQLFPIAIHENLASRDATYETILAGQKLEELRALTWGFDPRGMPISDPGLNSSPAGALGTNTPGFVDYVDQFGRSLGGGMKPPSDAIYTRRWAIEPLPADPNQTLVIQVSVMRTGPTDGGAAARSRRARLITVKGRKSR